MTRLNLREPVVVMFYRGGKDYKLCQEIAEG